MTPQSVTHESDRRFQKAMESKRTPEEQMRPYDSRQAQEVWLITFNWLQIHQLVQVIVQEGTRNLYCTIYSALVLPSHP